MEKTRTNPRQFPPIYRSDKSMYTNRNVAITFIILKIYNDHHKHSTNSDHLSPPPMTHKIPPDIQFI